MTKFTALTIVACALAIAAAPATQPTPAKTNPGLEKLKTLAGEWKAKDDEGEIGVTRTRCVATRLFGGHADNALPQLATATVNCRIFPGVDPNAIKAELEKIVADPGVAVSRNDNYVASIASPLRDDVVAAYTDAVHAQHPGAPIMPEMSTGASDARPFRVAGIPVYGVDGGWGVIPDDMRAHGRVERIPGKSLSNNVDHWVFMLKRLAGGG